MVVLFALVAVVLRLRRVPCCQVAFPAAFVGRPLELVRTVLLEEQVQYSSLA